MCLFLFLSLKDGVQQHRSPTKWNETDLDVSYVKKPHHTYDGWLISARLLLRSLNICTTHQKLCNDPRAVH